MRLSELLGAKVVDSNGDDLGPVRDVCGIAEGANDDESPPRDIRIDGVVCGGSGIGVRLGYERFDVRGPVLLAALFRRLERRAHYVEWSQVGRVEDDVIHLKVRAAEVAALSDALPKR